MQAPVFAMHLLSIMLTADPQVGARPPLPDPLLVEEALAAVRSARNPTFVDFRRGEKATDQVLVVGAVYSSQSEQRLTEELIDHFSSIYAVLERKGWLPFFTEIELVVPMPLMRVKAPLSLVKSLRDKTINRSAFAEQYEIHRLDG